MSITALNKGLHTISNEIGILYQVFKLPRMNNDPLMVNYGIWAADTEYLSGGKYGGRSAGCGFEWEEAVLGTIGETVERYASAFYNKEDRHVCSYKELDGPKIHPSEFALFHDEQHKDERFKIQKFTEDIELSWFQTTDLTNGENTWLPGQFIYMPFGADKNIITFGTSTGLAAHTNYYKAILSGLYESIERDSFVITWMQQLKGRKIRINSDIQQYIDSGFPTAYEWHFFDISLDLEIPTVFGICFGESEFGKFVAIGASTRATYGEALKKTIQEIGQAVPYFRYLLGEKKDWTPPEDYNMIQSFEDHSIFYTKKPELWPVFDHWINEPETFDVDFNEPAPRNDKEQIRHMVQIMKNKGYNVLVKDVTTHDVRQLGFYSIKTFVPQLIQLAGAYPFYFSGGKRLFTVPGTLGQENKDYHGLNKYPHPFP